MKNCCKQITLRMRKAIAEQAIVHNREVTALAAELVRATETLHAVIEMIGAARRNMWTPADDKRLDEIRKVTST